MTSNSISQDGGHLFNHYLPEELETKIFGFLKRSHKFIAMRVNKEWQKKAQHLSFWNAEAEELKLSNFQAITYEINQLLQTAKFAFDLTAPMGEQVEAKEKVQKGFATFFVLKRLGLITIERWEAVAKSYEHFYKDAWSWYQLAKAFLEEKNIDQALAVVDGHLLNSSQLWDWSIVEKVIVIYLENNSIVQAIALAKKYNEKVSFVTLNEECFVKICNQAKEQHNFALLERAIDEIEVDAKGRKVEIIISLIKIYSDQNEPNQMLRALKKYQNLMESYAISFFRWISSTSEGVSELIELYVNIQQYSLAWDFAFRHRHTAGGLTLRLLKEALMRHAAPEEHLQRVNGASNKI